MENIEADRRLIERMVAGDHHAARLFESRFRAVFQRALATARRRWKSVAIEPDDLSQQLLLMMLDDGARLLGTYRGLSPLEGWLHAVIVRHAHRHCGRRAKEARSRAPSFEDTVEESSPESLLMLEEEKQRARAVLSGLAHEDAVLLSLFFEQEAPAKEVAHALGVSVDTARMRKMRLLRQLKFRTRRRPAQSATKSGDRCRSCHH